MLFIGLAFNRPQEPRSKIIGNVLVILLQETQGVQLLSEEVERLVVELSCCSSFIFYNGGVLYYSIHFPYLVGILNRNIIATHSGSVYDWLFKKGLDDPFVVLPSLHIEESTNPILKLFLDAVFCCRLDC